MTHYYSIDKKDCNSNLCAHPSITGVGAVKDKQSTTMNRVTYLSATLEWQGSTHLFKKLPPEIYQRIPSPVVGKKVYVRFELTMLLRQENNGSGQMIMLQVPAITKIERDELETKSIPSSAASTLAGSGMAAKPVTPTTAPAVPGKS